jgi:metallo-beta-lactamase family protein
VFQEILSGQGYQAEAPYSGTEYDLLTGKMTVYTEGRKIDRSVGAKGTQRAQAVFDELVAAAEELLRLVKKRRGMTNKDNAKLTDQIRNLINKWKN